MQKIIVLIAILLIGYLSLGVEYIYKDHTDRYDPFIKSIQQHVFIFLILLCVANVIFVNIARLIQKSLKKGSKIYVITVTV